MANNATLTGHERSFDPGDIIVSKTDPKGIITYANDVFLEIADYTEAEVVGQPHSIIRHPHMPRCVFKLLWDRISAKDEIFAYVMNRTKYGDHYWVLAHVTPTFGANQEVAGYHSNRRVPNRKALDTIVPLYEKLRAEEERHANRKDGLAASFKMLTSTVDATGLDYDRFIYSLQQA